MKKKKIKIQKNLRENLKLFLVIFFMFLFFVFISTKDVFAAKLYLEPSEGEYQSGETFLVEIKIDTEGECINAVEANLNFSSNILNVVDFSYGESILTLWVKTPIVDQGSGLVSFIGGIPGSYCGRISGDPGESNQLGKIIFRTSGLTINESEKNIAEVKFLDSSQVILSDKLGTKADLSTQGATFKILSKEGETKDEWREILEADNISPEPFKIEIHKDPQAFEGRYFLIFSTTDKQTGIDYYEVKEGEGNWEKTVSPYLLKDQSLQNVIKVRAVDKAGNEQIFEIIPSIIAKKPFPYQIIVFIVIALMVILMIIRWAIKKLRNKK